MVQTIVCNQIYNTISQHDSPYVLKFEDEQKGNITHT
jgi:hypothetical protein